MTTPRLVPLESIESLDDGEVIPAIEGTIAEVYERKSGENAYGPWSFQDAMISHNGEKVKLKFVNMDDMADLKGKLVRIEANHSKQHGFTGVTKMIDEYNGKTYHKVKLTQSCKIRPTNGGSTEEADEIPMKHDPKGHPIDTQSLDKAHEHLRKASHGVYLALEYAYYVAKQFEEDTKTKLTTDQIQSITATLFIDLQRAGFINNLPTLQQVREGK
jgi:hypothetical protein